MHSIRLLLRNSKHTVYNKTILICIGIVIIRKPQFVNNKYPSYIIVSNSDLNDYITRNFIKIACFFVEIVATCGTCMTSKCLMSFKLKVSKRNPPAKFADKYLISLFTLIKFHPALPFGNKFSKFPPASICYYGKTPHEFMHEIVIINIVGKMHATDCN